ncbi:hypothetical protein [Metabacillus malikii]|uniref:Protein associated with RNAse G/E n=1 Tax=Metabacillus malikii TaxID=1504265 RepID=A0ABT9ZHN7_9BACI|nr:hypothetical protein [Metabacillus malikii]MDQ0231782.1 protein associated with RNAse G/E [Metabacillus malikii]
MGLAILFRRNPRTSPFRNAAIDMIKYRAGSSDESLLIGTGYIDSTIIWGKSYKKGPDKDELIQAICDGYADNENVYLVAGGYDDKDKSGGLVHTPNARICKSNGSKWYNSTLTEKCNSCEFEFFSKLLKYRIQQPSPIGFSRNINIHHFKCQEKTNYRWHAKVIMKISEGKPYAFIIGSSNLTNVAFEFNPKWKYTNFECDVVVYPNEHRKMFDKKKYELGTFLPTRAMNLSEVEELSKTFVKDFLDSKLLDDELAKEIFDHDFLNEVKENEYTGHFLDSLFDDEDINTD